MLLEKKNRLSTGYFWVARNEYREEVKTSKQNGWRSFCNEIEGVVDAAKLIFINKSVGSSSEADEQILAYLILQAEQWTWRNQHAYGRETANDQSKK